MRCRNACFLLSLGIFASRMGTAQSIGPDGRVLPAYSGRETTSPAPAAASIPISNAPASPNTPGRPSAARSDAGSRTACPTANGAYYLQDSSWVAMEPIHSVGFKTTNVAGAAFTYGATKSRVKAQFREARSPYQLRESGFSICLVGIADTGRDISVVRFQEEKDRRELSMGSYRIWTGVSAQVDAKVIIRTSVEKKSDKVYLVTSEEHLPQGEFILFTIVPDVAAMVKANRPTSLGGYDFGHHAE
jgi:hypothetical protein